MFVLTKEPVDLDKMRLLIAEQSPEVTCHTVDVDDEGMTIFVDDEKVDWMSE